MTFTAVAVVVVLLLLHSAQCTKWHKDVLVTDLSRHHHQPTQCGMLIFGPIARPTRRGLLRSVLAAGRTPGVSC